MCYMQNPVRSRVRSLASALELRPEENSNANDVEEQMQRRIDAMTLFKDIYNDYEPYGLAQWVRPSVVEEMRACGVLTLEQFVELRAFEIVRAAREMIPTSMEGFDEVASEESLSLAEERVGEEDDGETAKILETGGGGRILSSSAPSPVGFWENGDSLLEVDTRDAGAGGRNGMSHGDVAGSQSRDTVITYSSPRVMIPSELFSTLVELSTALSQIVGVELGSETREGIE